MNTDRQKEVYDDLFKNPDANYGSICHGIFAIDLIKSLGVKSVLDVGCGNNSFKQLLLKENIDCVGCDIVSPQADFNCFSDELPFDNKSFDCITCFDVLEHLFEQQVQPTFNEFKRVGQNYVIVCISYDASGKNAQNYGNLHQTVKPKDWWIKHLNKVLTDVKEYKNKTDPKSPVKGQYIYGKIKDGT